MRGTSGLITEPAHPFHLPTSQTAPACHNSRTLLSRDVKTLSCVEWQQLGQQMLTFNGGCCRSSLLLFLLSIALIPLVGIEQHLQAMTACIMSFYCRNISPSNMWVKGSSFYRKADPPFSLMIVRFGLKWVSSSAAKFCAMDMLFQNREIYSKQYKELPKLYTAHQGVLDHSESDPKPQGWVWTTCTRNAGSPKLTLNLTHP